MLSCVFLAFRNFFSAAASSKTFEVLDDIAKIFVASKLHNYRNLSVIKKQIFEAISVLLSAL